MRKRRRPGLVHFSSPFVPKPTVVKRAVVSGAGEAGRRVELIGLLEEGSESLRRLADVLREKTLVLE
jgi:hypothetical protein